MRGGTPLPARLAGVAMAALAGAGIAVARQGEDLMERPRSNGKVYGAGNIKRMLQQHGRSRQFGSFDPRVNAWTGQPHEHAREITRRQRQAERNTDRQRDRQERKNGVGSPFPGISRRGNFTTWPNGTPAVPA